MFDQILELVKEHVGNHPQIAGTIPAGHEDAVHQEIATHVADTLTAHGEQTTGGISGLLSQLQEGIASGGPVVSALEGGLMSMLTTKFGLPPAVTGAISGALPGLLQKFATKQTSA